MSQSNLPEYFILSSISKSDGTHTVLGIFENLDALSYRLKSLYIVDGSEYLVSCFKLRSADEEAEEYDKLLINKRKSQQERLIKGVA